MHAPAQPKSTTTRISLFDSLKDLLSIFLFLMEPLPSTNRVFSMVIQYERQQLPGQAIVEEQNSFANAAEKRHFSNKGKGVSYDGAKGNPTHNSGNQGSNKEWTHKSHCGRLLQQAWTTS
ncbi:hypothetical protein AAZX31_20G061700 [Glycine max]